MWDDDRGPGLSWCSIGKQFAVTVITEPWLLLLAGFVGGAINTVAGGGSFVTFPALLAAGVPPVSANATNTFASCPGYLSGAFGLRSALRPHRTAIPLMVGLGLAGGGLGAAVLLAMPEARFREIIPWLLLFATVLFAIGGRLNRLLRHLTVSSNPSLSGRAASGAALFLVCVYGGFFNAGLGILLLSYLAAAGFSDIHAMNGLKLLISAVASLTAIALFVVAGAIAWFEGTLVLIGTLVGGYAAAHWSLRLPQAWVRGAVIATGAALTLYYFRETLA